ncbi:LytR/AlgR family response regulator transcription factor [Rubrivirga sp.]|uniref:LytR/AlgR family response regulator transcription factor n=1 Tax=Rubrivirga sp. TaxID=1885344 RepID=UPI003C72A003
MTLRALVADDEPLARDTVRLLLDPVEGVDLEWEAADGQQAVDTIREHQPDLVFLDVQMPHLDGFGVIEAVGPDAMPTTVFVTAFDHHALQAFDAAAVDYLVKPYDDARFHRALDRARTFCSPALEADAASDVALRLRALLDGRDLETADRLLVREGTKLVVVEAESIDWIEASGDYVALHVGPRTHLLRETLSGVVARLDGRRFARVHRSTAIQVDRVRDVRPLASGDARLRLRDGTELRVSRRYWKELEARLGGAA